jgi:hypothetical protein
VRGYGRGRAVREKGRQTIIPIENGTGCIIPQMLSIGNFEIDFSWFAEICYNKISISVQQRNKNAAA